MDDQWWCLCWSKQQNALHIERFANHLSANANAFAADLDGDYRLMFVGRREDVDAAAAVVRSKVMEREAARAERGAPMTATKGLAARLLEFFAANPDEVLMFDDAAAKFGVDTQAGRRNLSSTLTMLKARGALDVQRVTLIQAARGDEQ